MGTHIANFHFLSCLGGIRYFGTTEGQMLLGVSKELGKNEITSKFSSGPGTSWILVFGLLNIITDHANVCSRDLELYHLRKGFVNDCFPFPILKLFVDFAHGGCTRTRSSSQDVDTRVGCTRCRRAGSIQDMPVGYSLCVYVCEKRDRSRERERFERNS